MSRLSPKDIEERIAAISRVLDDPATAHQREDELRLDFIKHVAATQSVPDGVRKKACLIIEVSKWEFSRWMS